MIVIDLRSLDSVHKPQFLNRKKSQTRESNPRRSATRLTNPRPHRFIFLPPAFLLQGRQTRQTPARSNPSFPHGCFPCRVAAVLRTPLAVVDASSGSAGAAVGGARLRHLRLRHTYPRQLPSPAGRPGRRDSGYRHVLGHGEISWCHGADTFSLELSPVKY